MMWLSRGQMSFGGFAVAIFFFASGFYVTKSLLANTALTFVINVLAAALIYHLVEVPCTKWLSKK